VSTPSDPRPALLIDGIRRLDLDVRPDQCAVLIQFLDLLEKWNRVYSLTAIEPGPAMVRRHLLDSLAMLPYISGPRVLDLGTGPGLPGIPFAVARPDWRLTLLDANRKKARFVQQAVLELRLVNVEVVNARAEDFQPPQPFDTVVTRAVSTASATVQLAQHLIAVKGGRLVLMKGSYPQSELTELPAGFRVMAVHEVAVPGLDAERHAVIIQPPN
jgi:16S rRNA (guanine527-N7)-methyltransferase